MAKVEILICCLLFALPTFQGKENDDNTRINEELKSLREQVERQQQMIKSQEQLIIKQQKTSIEQQRINEQLREMNLQQDERLVSIENEMTRIQLQASNNAVAFSAYAPDTKDYEEGNIVQFPTQLLDTSNSYDTDQGIFICPANGLYLFTASVLGDDDRSMVAEIVVNGVHSVRFYEDDRDEEQSSNTVLAECLESQKVWVECTASGRQMKGSRSSSFSGVLISIYP